MQIIFYISFTDILCRKIIFLQKAVAECLIFLLKQGEKKTLQISPQQPYILMMMSSKAVSSTRMVSASSSEYSWSMQVCISQHKWWTHYEGGLTKMQGIYWLLQSNMNIHAQTREFLQKLSNENNTLLLLRKNLKQWCMVKPIYYILNII